MSIEEVTAELEKLLPEIGEQHLQIINHACVPAWKRLNALRAAALQLIDAIDEEEAQQLGEVDLADDAQKLLKDVATYWCFGIYAVQGLAALAREKRRRLIADGTPRHEAEEALATWFAGFGLIDTYVPDERDCYELTRNNGPYAGDDGLGRPSFYDNEIAVAPLRCGRRLLSPQGLKTMLTHPRRDRTRYTEVRILAPVRCGCGHILAGYDADIGEHLLRFVCSRCHAVLIEIEQLVEHL